MEFLLQIHMFQNFSEKTAAVTMSLNKFIAFKQPKIQLSARKTGSRLATTLDWCRTAFVTGWELDYCDQWDQVKQCCKKKKKSVHHLFVYLQCD